ncbi:hypothetical protein KKF61_06340 [Patescibacteria group bacterium]|nr:hypothetical protein [Patescibacteria group bacterium]MBU0964513.1 hypothetical protein [Patescibacteria group bacterium]
MQNQSKTIPILIIILVILVIGIGIYAAVTYEAPITQIVNSNIAIAANINLDTNTTSVGITDWQMVNYSSGQHNFSLEVPTDWQVVKQPAHNEERRSFITVYDKQGIAADALTVSFYSNPNVTLGEWVTEHKQELVRSHEDIIESESDYSNSERKVVIAEMKEVFKHAYCYIQADDEVYEIYLSSELDSWSQYQDIFDHACSSFQSLSGAVETSDWLTYENEEYGFSFKYPEIWTINEKPTGLDDQGIYTIVFNWNYRTSELYPMLMIRDNWSNEQEINDTTSVSTVTIKSEEDHITVADLYKTKKIVYVDEDGQAMPLQKIFFTKDGTSYIIRSFNGNQETGDAIDQLLSSFQFIE